jgi:hypothetical protein
MYESGYALHHLSDLRTGRTLTSILRNLVTCLSTLGSDLLHIWFLEYAPHVLTIRLD